MLDRKKPSIEEMISQINNPEARALFVKLCRDVLSELVGQDDFAQIYLVKRLSESCEKVISDFSIENVNGDRFESSEFTNAINNIDVGMQLLKDSTIAVQILTQADLHTTFTVLDLKNNVSDPTRIMHGIEDLFDQGLIEYKEMVERRRSGMASSRHKIRIYRITPRGHAVMRAFEKSN